MTALLAIAIFSGGMGVACWAIGGTVVPSLDRISDALLGRRPAGFAPLAQLAVAERRIAVRRWAAASPVPVRRRAAA